MCSIDKKMFQDVSEKDAFQLVMAHDNDDIG